MNHCTLVVGACINTL